MAPTITDELNRRERRYVQLTRIAAEFSADLTEEQREGLLHPETWLYDDAGLPVDEQRLGKSSSAK